MNGFSFSFAVKNNWNSVVAEGYYTPQNQIVLPKIPRRSKTWTLVKGAVDFMVTDRLIQGCTLENGWTVTKIEAFIPPEIETMHEAIGYDA